MISSNHRKLLAAYREVSQGIQNKQDMPAWLVSAMEYQSRKIVLRKDRIIRL